MAKPQLKLLTPAHLKRAVIVTVGDLLHTERHLVSPAMVKAYELESKVAKFPRVLLDPIARPLQI